MITACITNDAQLSHPHPIPPQLSRVSRCCCFTEHVPFNLGTLTLHPFLLLHLHPLETWLHEPGEWLPIEHPWPARICTDCLLCGSCRWSHVGHSSILRGHSCCGTQPSRRDRAATGHILDAALRSSKPGCGLRRQGHSTGSSSCAEGPYPGPYAMFASLALMTSSPLLMRPTKQEGTQHAGTSNDESALPQSSRRSSYSASTSPCTRLPSRAWLLLDASHARSRVDGLDPS